MDVDAYVAAHRGEWQRLEQLLGRPRLDGDEVDELVRLYQRVTTHLSVVRSASPDPALVGRLTTLVARSRARVTGTSSTAWRDIARFFTVSYPAALYRSARWWVSVGAAFVLVGLAVGAWVATHQDVQASIAAPAQIRQLVEHDFEAYYSSSPAGSFAAKVATNNAWVTALSLALGVLIVPVLWIQWQNALNVGIAGGLMAGAGRLDLFFGLILPHGLLELTCVFVAAGAGLRLGWSWIDPGPRTRSQALMQEGQAAGALAIGLAVTLLVSGAIEAFVTPSPLPTWARVGIGAAVWAAFLTYVVVLGGRAVRAGSLGDVEGAGATDVAPVAA
ncbi:MAG: stage II sporulation protein M [Actinomycetes bacterium]